MKPLCADLFADDDLRRVAEVVQVENYPHDLPRIAADFPDAPWIYVGALENYPRIIGQICEQRPLLGNGPESLARVRDPFQLADCLLRAGLPTLDVRPQNDPPPRDGNWLRKPLRSAGGMGINVWDTSATGDAPRRHYFQRRAIGESYSALFFAFPSGVVSVGITRQLIGCREFHAAPFAYSGSIGPVEVPRVVQQQLQQLAECIAKFGNLRGLFGCDFILDGDTPWITEVNPRYTASVEIYERAWDTPLLAWHVQACRPSSKSCHDSICDRIEAARSEQVGVQGKAVLFAPHRMRISESSQLFERTAMIADVPIPGTTIEPGHPICTLFAAAADSHICFAELEQAASLVLRALTSGGAGG